MRIFCPSALIVLLFGGAFHIAFEIWPATCWKYGLSEVAAEPPNHTCQSNSFASLDEKGYAVFSNFTSPELLARIEAWLDSQPWEFDMSLDVDDESRMNWQIDFLHKQGLDPIIPVWQELKSVSLQFWDEARKRLNFPLVEEPLLGFGHYFLNESLRGSQWHVDTQHVCRDAETSTELNLVLMVKKTHRDSGGLSFVGLDTLRNRVPHLEPILADTGGTEVEEEFERFGGTLLKHTASDCVYVFNSTLDELGCSLDAGPGDVFVYRNDLFHRTQRYHRGTREGVFIRFHSRCSLRSSLKGGRQKYWHLLFNEEPYARYWFERNVDLLKEKAFPALDKYFPKLAHYIGVTVWQSLCLFGYALREVLYPLRLLMEACLYGSTQMHLVRTGFREAAVEFCSSYTSQTCNRFAETEE